MKMTCEKEMIKEIETIVKDKLNLSLQTAQYYCDCTILIFNTTNFTICIYPNMKSEKDVDYTIFKCSSDKLKKYIEVFESIESIVKAFKKKSYLDSFHNELCQSVELTITCSYTDDCYYFYTKNPNHAYNMYVDLKVKVDRNTFLASICKYNFEIKDISDMKTVQKVTEMSSKLYKCIENHNNKLKEQKSQ